MLATILISAVLLALAVLAIRRIRKKGSCDCGGCSDCPHSCCSAQPKQKEHGAD